MTEALAKLREIGIQQIHEDTHISRQHVESILDEDLDDLTKVQLLGFLSILEREYSVDLSELRSKAQEYYIDNESIELEDGNVKVFTPPKKRLTPIYIILVIAVFVAFFYFDEFSKTKSPEIIKVDNSAIESATSNISIKIDGLENNTSSNDTNISEKPVSRSEVTKIEVTEDELLKTENETTSLKIIPKYRVWLGYIDLETHKKSQKTFSDEFELETDKDYILVFGHGYISIDINGQVNDYRKKEVMFSYIDSKLQEISLEEFKALNKGDRW